MSDLPAITANNVTITGNNSSFEVDRIDRQNAFDGVGLVLKGNNDSVSSLMISDCSGIGVAIYGNNDSVDTSAIGCDFAEQPGGYSDGIGIYVFHGYGANISQNFLEFDENDGIQVFQSSQVVVFNNQIENDLNGIHVIGQSENLSVNNVTGIYENTIDENSQYGIYLEGSSYN